MTRLAAVDLGSNSFRLEIGQYSQLSRKIKRVAYCKETVRIGSGLDTDGKLSPQAMQIGWDCLARFGQQLQSFQTQHVRAVTTQTLREAKNANVFLATAQQMLGFPIEIISGEEEARLIYQGVAHSLPQNSERRLVIDIGGRSTELILGQDFTANVLGSFQIGSMSWSKHHFEDGVFSTTKFEEAKQAAFKVLSKVASTYPRQAWDTAYGSSGSVKAVAEILAKAGFIQGCITREGLDWLQKKLIKSGHATKVKLVGLKKDRRPIIGGGVSVLLALFEVLSIETLHFANGSLRHGVMHELIK